MDEEGIPKEAQRRLEIAKKIVAAAEAYGIPAEDVIIDPLAMAVGADHRVGVITLEAMNLIRIAAWGSSTRGRNC